MSQWKTLKSWLRFSRDSVTVVTSGATAVLGFLAVVGWHLHQSHWIQISPSFAPITYNAALGFFLLGMAGLALASGRASLALFFGSLVMILGFGSVCQDFFQGNFGLDQTLMQPYLSYPGAPPGRMSLATALSFLILGPAFILGRRQYSWLPLLQSFVGLAVIAIGFIGFFGYLTKLEGAIRWGSAGPLSVQEAVGLCLIGLGVAALGWRQEFERGAFSLQWLPWQVGFGIIVATSLMHYALVVREEEKFTEFLSKNALNIRNELLARLEGQAVPLLNLTRRWEIEATGQRERIKQFETQIRHIHSFQKIDWVYPNETKLRLLQDATKTRKPVVLSADPLDPGKFELFVPVFSGKKSDGFLRARFHVVELMEFLLQDNLSSGFWVTLWEGRTQLFARGNGIWLDKTGRRKGVSLAMSFFSKPWVLQVSPTLATFQKEKTWVPLAISFLGLMAAMMFAGIIRLAQTAQVRAWETELANADLKEEIEARERIRAELETVSQAAVQATAAKSEFLANMSHEIRTPLNAVIGMSELLSGTKLNGEQKDLVNTIRYSADALLTLINDILDFSKIEAGKLDLETIDFDLTELVKSTCAILKSSAENKGLKLRTSLATQLPKAMRGDEARLRQILINLVNNAIKFTERGEVIVSVAPFSNDQNSRIKFVVTDTGVGIAEIAQSRIFKSFSQADSSMTRKYGGTGLGLSICKRLVELMGGTIGFQSVIGKGSTFWFEVPLQQGTLAVKTKRAKAKKLKRKASFKLLVVEDNPINQKVISKMLTKLGYSCRVANQGKEALEAVGKETFHLVLMDCQMPEMDGYEATRRLRMAEQGARRRLPVIALTAHALKEDRQKCLDAGMDDFLTKPIDIQHLEQAIARWLNAEPSTLVASQQKRKTAKRSGVIDDKVFHELMSLSEPGEEALFLGDMLRMFKQGSGEALAMLTEAAERKNTELLSQVAHKLKSGAGNLGAMKMASLCKEMELFAKEGHFERAVAILPRLQKEFLLACEDLDERMKQLPDAFRKVA